MAGRGLPARPAGRGRGCAAGSGISLSAPPPPAALCPPSSRPAPAPPPADAARAPSPQTASRLAPGGPRALLRRPPPARAQRCSTPPWPPAAHPPARARPGPGRGSGGRGRGDGELRAGLGSPPGAAAAPLLEPGWRCWAAPSCAAPGGREARPALLWPSLTQCYAKEKEKEEKKKKEGNLDTGCGGNERPLPGVSLSAVWCL